MDEAPTHEPTTPDQATTRAVMGAGHGPDNGPDVAELLTRRLAVFGVASVLGGTALALATTRATARAYGQQSAIWGAINLAIAGIAAQRATAHPARAVRLRRTLLVNAALDVGYVAVGAHVAFHRTTFGGRQSPQAALGHGLAIVDQALGLLALDLVHARALRG